MAIVLVAASIFAFAWLYRFNDPGGTFAYLTDDHFFYLVRGWQILLGELPVRDFVDHGAPLFYYVGAAVQLIFGRGTLSEIVFCVTVLAACAVGVFLLATRASGSFLLAVPATAFHVLLEPRFYNYPKILAYVAAIPALWAFADRPGPRRAALVAVITVVAFLFRHDHGAFIAAAFALLLILLRSLSWRQRARHALLYGAFVLVLVLPYVAFIELNGGVATYFRTAAAWAQRDRDRAEIEWPSLLQNAGEVSPVPWLFYSELAIPFATVLMLVVSPRAFRPDWSNASAKLGVVAALAVMLNAGFLRSPLDARLADPSVPHAILIAWLPLALTRLFTRPDQLAASLHRPLARRFVQLAALLSIVPLLVVIFTAVTSGIETRLAKTSLRRPADALERAEIMWQRIGGAFPLVPDAPLDDGRLTTLALYLRECTQPGDRVFMQHYLPQVLALGERGFAGGHADLRPGFFTSTEMQNLTVERLRRQSVPIALVGGGPELGGFRSSFPIVVRYFDEQYAYEGDRTFDDRFVVRLLVDRDRKPTGRFEPLGWPCFR